MQPTSAPLLGQSFGKCRLLDLIGRGGMGSVYLAEHLFLHRRVAIKILSRDLSAIPEEVERFEREAVSAAKLDHPNIVRIYDVDEEGGRPYIVMEYVEGEDLERLIRREAPLPPRRAAGIVKEVARALDHAHAAGVVHRDVTPGNVLLARDGRIKITDFGLALEMNRAETPVDGALMGTPFYVSPEQAQGLPADGRSDLYSLGVTFYQMLTGDRPFGGRTPESVARKHIEMERPEARRSRKTVPRSVSAIVRRLMAVRPADRFPDAKALLRELELFLAGTPFLRRREAGSPAGRPGVPPGLPRRG